MKDLAAHEAQEVEDAVWEFIQNRKFDGLHCVVVLNGRGLDKVAYAKDDAEAAPTMLAHAYRSARDYKAKHAN